MNGLELISKFKYLQENNHVPIILITGSYDVDKQSIDYPNFLGILHKPFSVNEFYLRINQL
ncbi:MAG: hypothetical protein ABIC91_02940 [Nanoarchaeota archaeon]|nr:hypothetical protein [Nanoarchaeota archaeon]MBU1030546.1 hypothetical protein [Nanoarchaeota archaeon]MBU1850547.1 hypothetical protein [Nanoarchaeota archaeon]